jgi:UDP:flavonoid glycosyltransferase YjiC (YdhE family)
MVVFFYISGHGLGHASRDLEVVDSLIERRPDVRVVLRTSASRWFFETTRRDAIELQAAEVDTGVVQIDSLRLDEGQTARRAAAFYATFDERARAEAALLTREGASVVVGDIPPLAFAAAGLARVPSIALSNFTWDWIYAGYPEFERTAPVVISTIRDAYSQTTLALRLPMHGGFEPMAAVTRDTALIARRATRPRAVIRRALGIDDTRTVVLASFGGYGLRLPYEAIAASGAFTLVATSHELGGSATRKVVIPGDVPYPDLVAAADVVVSKPGYGIVSECIANDTAFLYTTRGRFAEQEVMTAQMPRALRCRSIPQEDLLAGRWTDAVEALLAQPPPPERWATNGAALVAEEILGLAVR